MNLKVLVPLAFLVLLTAGIYAQCNATQVNINSANATELDRLYGIGPTKAQSIISYRGLQRFNSLDELINVSGIGPATLGDIKLQGLACVNPIPVQQNNSTSSETDSASSNLSENPTGNSANEQGSSTSGDNPGNLVSSIRVSNLSAPANSSGANPVAPKVIELSQGNQNPTGLSAAPKDYSIKSHPAIYGLAAFSVLLAGLFAARKFKTKRYKSEFN